MEELENASPTMGDPGENPANPNSTNIENPATEPQSTDFSQLFSENIAEETPVKEELAQEEPIQQEEISSPAQSELQEVQPELQKAQPELQETQPESDNTETATQVTEAATTQTNVLNPEFTNNENDIQISEHAFDKQIANTSLDNHQNIQTAQVTAEQRKAAIEQQKLAWLKQHESKAKKSGFTSWILSGILLMLLAFAACSVFAKDQILNAIDYLETLIPLNSSTTNNVQNTVVPEIDLPEIEETELVEEDTEEVDEIQAYYNKVDEIVSSESDPETKTEQLKNILTDLMKDEEPNGELTQYISQAIMDLTVNTEEAQNEQNNNAEPQESTEENTLYPEYNETVEENNENNLPETWENTNNEQNTGIEPSEILEEQIIEPYTITHVNTEEEANWVLPAHCSDLTCYWEDQEFVECTSFKMIETLDENTSRVSSRWGCKYKDTSELVYVKFSDAHNSADTTEDTSTLTVSMTITPTTNTWWKEIRFKSTVNNSDEIVDYEWDFGDWKSTNSQFAAEVSHIYWQKWVYTVTLTVYDKNWNTSTTTQSVTILEVGESIN